MTSSRRTRRTRTNESGFTLLELMMAITILAVLAVIPIQQFSMFKAEARRTEATIALGAIRQAQEAFHDRYGYYAQDFNELQFFMAGGTTLSSNSIRSKVYTYQLTRPGDENTWMCTATGNIDGDAWLDVITTGIM